MLISYEVKGLVYFLLSLHFPHQEQILTLKFFAVSLKDNSEIPTAQYVKRFQPQKVKDKIQLSSSLQFPCAYLGSHNPAPFNGLS